MLYFFLIVILLFLCVMKLMWLSNHSPLEPPVLSGWLPIVGHGHRLIGNSVHMLKTLLEGAEECIEKGGLVTAYLGTHKVYGIADPDDSLTLMNDCLQKPFFYKFAEPLLGKGLLTADVQTWKKNRKLLNPAFNQQVLDGFIEVFNIQAKKLVAKFAEEIGKPFDHENLLRINNLETLCSTSFGVEAEDSEYNAVLKQYLQRLLRVFELINERGQKFWLYSDYIYNLTKEKKELDEEVKHMTALSKLIIDKKKSEREKQSNTNTMGKLKTFIDLILDLAEDTDCLTEKQMQWETDTIMVAGHDTAATTLTFTLAVLGSHPEVQERAYKEVHDVLGNSEKSIGKEDLSKLTYIDTILKEVLRLYSVTSILPRFTDKDVKLKNYTIKANSDCVIYLYGLLRLKTLWGPDAEQFRPERWLNKETLPDPKYYGAFGLGRRACIGKSYAMMMMKINLAHVLRKYHIRSDISKMVLAMHTLVRPHSGHFITLTLRKDTKCS